MTLAAAAPTDSFTEVMDHVGQGFEALGAAILVVALRLIGRKVLPGG